jgi:multidrug transporter EmrE-like cation transporter
MAVSWLLLIISALCETFYNIFIKRSEGWYDWKNNIWVVIFVIGSIIGFKKALNTIPLSIAITVWSGVAIVTTILLDIIIFKTKTDFKIMFFMTVCVISIVCLNYYSSQSEKINP